MQVSPQIVLRDVPDPEAVERRVSQLVARLEKFSDRITGCRVLVERPRRHRQGNLYHVRLEVALPGKKIVVRRDPSAHHEHEDVHAALRDAFDAARRRVEDWVRVREGAVKAHARRA